MSEGNAGRWWRGGVMTKLTDSGLGISEVRSLPGLDTTGLAVSLPTLLVGLACCHWKSSEHLGQNEMCLLTGSEQANVFRGDDLKVRPTECILSINFPLFFVNFSTCLFVCLLVCLFVGIKPEKLFCASCVGREANPLGVITHGQRHTGKPHAYQRKLHFFQFFFSFRLMAKFLHGSLILIYNHSWPFFVFLFEIHKLVRQLHQERTQMEVQL